MTFVPDPDGINLVVLDVDGVLNCKSYLNFCYDNGVLPDDRIDPKAVAILNALVRATSSKILVSSDWRLPYLPTNDLQGLKDLLTGRHGVYDVIIGMTNDDRDWGKPSIRGNQIQDWLDYSGVKVKSIVILDDCDDMVHLRKYLIQTNKKIGLQRSHMLDAIQMLDKGNKK
jgi:hypothetical protein